MGPKLLPLAMLPLAWAAPQTPIKSVPPAGIEIASGGSRRIAGRARPSSRRDGKAGEESAAAGRIDLPGGGALRARVQRILQGGRGCEGPPAAAAGRAARRRSRARARALDHRDGPGGPRLHFEDRSQRAALRAGGSGVVFAHGSAPLAARRLVPRAQRDAERSEFPGGPREAISANGRLATPSCCISTGDSATPAGSPARWISSKRWTP